MTEPDAPAAAEALVALAGPSQQPAVAPPPALELLQPALSAILRESDWDTLTYRSIRTELRRMLGKAAVPDAWLRPAVNHAMWARKTEEAVERELGADRSLSMRELRRRVEAALGAPVDAELVRRRADAWHAAANARNPKPSAPATAIVAAGVAHVYADVLPGGGRLPGSRAKRPPVAVAALPEPPAAADGGAVVVRRKRRGISAATRVPAPKRATAAEILIHDALESQPRRRATLKKLCRALKARPVAAAMLGAPLKARVREVLRRRTDLFEKVKPKKAPAADGDGGGAAPKKAVRWTVAATSPLAATTGPPAPSENRTSQ